MKRSAPKTLILAAGILIGIMLIAGCEEEENLSDTKPDAKRSRLIAVENAQLKEQIEELKKLHASEMGRQKNLHTEELKIQKGLLDKCMQEKKAFEDMSKKGLENYMQVILAPIVEENAKLQEEIKTLKAQLEEAKK